MEEYVHLSIIIHTLLHLWNNQIALYLRGSKAWVFLQLSAHFFFWTLFSFNTHRGTSMLAIVVDPCGLATWCNITSCITLYVLSRTTTDTASFSLFVKVCPVYDAIFLFKVACRIYAPIRSRTIWVPYVVIATPTSLWGFLPPSPISQPRHSFYCFTRLSYFIHSQTIDIFGNIFHLFYWNFVPHMNRVSFSILHNDVLFTRCWVTAVRFAWDKMFMKNQINLNYKAFVFL